jgi:hypothetical protein
MSRHEWLLAGAVVASLVLAGPARANDVWELSGENNTDDDSETWNQLLHGMKQTHDAQGTGASGTVADFDWIRVATRVRHSYEVRTSGSPMTQSGGECPNCGQLQRVLANGTVLQTAVGPDGTINGSVGVTHMALRWFGSANQQEYVRVRGLDGFSTTPNDTYDVEFFDTTYFGPRFNQTGSQTTVIFVQNANHDVASSPITGFAYFYNAAGSLLDVAVLNVPVDGFQVIRTSEMPQLAGQSGAVTIAHDGGYGALAAKAVALEPATGFSFDTPFTPIPR